MGIQVENFFIRSKKKKNTYKSLDIIDRKNLEELDLIEFKINNQVYRGMVRAFIKPGLKGMEQAKTLFNKNLIDAKELFTDIRTILRWKITESEFSSERLLVERVKKTAKSMIVEYFAIERSDILYIESLDPNVLYESLLKTCKKMNDLDIKIAINGEMVSKSHVTSYDPEKNCILISWNKIIEYAMSNFLENRLLISETFEILIAHELGHASKKSKTLYTSRVKEIRERLNKAGKKTLPFESTISILFASHKEKEIRLQLLKEAILLAKEYKKFEFKAEMAAFENGLKYISEHLQPAFELDNYQNYLAYEKKADERILSLQEQLNLLEKLILRNKLV